MGRPTTKRRLRDINPDDFGNDVAERVEAHLTTMIPSGSNASVKRQTRDISAAASSLARYALDGTIDKEHADKVFAAVLAGLYSSVMHTPTAVEDVDLPDDDIGIVLLAAHARLRLRNRQAIPVRELACLAGVDPDHVRLLARQGEIAIAGGVIAPQIAKPWLAARGVPLPS